MSTASALAQLESLDREYFDSGIPHLGDGVCVALVGDDHAGLDRDGVVRVVPLLAFLLVLIATRSRRRSAFSRRARPELREEVWLDRDVEVALLLARTQADCLDLVDDLG